MPRYIDADTVNEKIDNIQNSLESNDDNVWYKNKPYYKGLAMARGVIDETPTADVVPKSVVDALKLEVENEILKRERQRQILNHYALQYGTVRDQQAVIDKAKSEVAWEIFKEIERLMFDGLIGGKYLAKVIAPEKYAELKKKYTEGNK